jgi:hypothetical protein
MKSQIDTKPPPLKMKNQIDTRPPPLEKRRSAAGRSPKIPENLIAGTLLDIPQADIIGNPKIGVRSICIKKLGRQRGVRLLHIPSVHDYFDRLSREQEVTKCRV